MKKNPSYHISCYLEIKRWKSRKIGEVSPIAQHWCQERVFRIGTASRFGELVHRKAPVNGRFLHSLVSSTKVQTEAMKYGLEMETVVVEEFIFRPSSKSFQIWLADSS